MTDEDRRQHAAAEASALRRNLIAVREREDFRLDAVFAALVDQVEVIAFHLDLEAAVTPAPDPRVAFADLPDYLRSEIATDWSVLESEAGDYFATLTALGRWEIVTAFMGTSPIAALQTYLARADAVTLRDLGSLLLARSLALESAA